MKTMVLRGPFRLMGVVCAGSFKEHEQGGEGSYKVCLAPELKLDDHASVSHAIEDYGLPSDIPSYLQSVEEATVRALRGEPVYVGCMAGIGRTGTFLSLMVKMASGYPNTHAASLHPAILYVREAYHSSAVETAMQEDFVGSTPVLWHHVRIRARVLWWALQRRLGMV